jgi:hypothetical protein
LETCPETCLQTVFETGSVELENLKQQTFNIQTDLHSLQPQISEQGQNVQSQLRLLAKNVTAIRDQMTTRMEVCQTLQQQQQKQRQTPSHSPKSPTSASSCGDFPPTFSEAVKLPTAERVLQTSPTKTRAKKFLNIARMQGLNVGGAAPTGETKDAVDSNQTNANSQGSSPAHQNSNAAPQPQSILPIGNEELTFTF